jgi:NAD(P)-dependent dehydrogenase (short-subunit alcohol dehydrogenase family)
MAYNPMDMQDRSVLVTGASSGIGRATCILLSRLGARIILVGRNAAKLEQTQACLEGGHHEIIHCDLSDAGQLPNRLKQLAQATGAIHGLVHCAGIETVCPIQFLKMDDIDRTLDINLRSAFGLAKAFRQKGVGDRNGSMVFISSIMGVVGQPGASAYCASKGAIVALTKALALELAPMRVNCVAPAVVETPMTDRFRSKLTDAQFEGIVKMHPLGLGKATDVAHAIAFLLADTGRWVTGTTMVIDGGYSAH